MSFDPNIIAGPVIPLPVPFSENYAVDYESLSTYVDFLCSKGIKNIMTTVGTSRFNLLSWEEMKKVNETVVKAANNRAVTMVANGTTGGLDTAKDFAKHSQSIGADFLLLYFPERHYGEYNTYNFVKQVAESTEINILLHEMPMRNGIGPGQVQYSKELLTRLFAIPNIVGMKEEALDVDYSNELVSTFKDEAIIIGAGGGMSRYLFRDYELGAKAFLGGIGNFQPEIELEFFEAITNGNRNLADEIVKNIELPYFEKVVPIGWHPSLKAALALKGFMLPHERPPMKQVSGSELEAMKETMKQNGWIG